jgi:hypothetical protein
VGATTTLPLSDDANQRTVRFPDAPGNTGDAERDRPLVDYIATGPATSRRSASASSPAARSRK